MRTHAETAFDRIRWPQPGEVWSLWDMLNENLRKWIFIGERMEELRVLWLDIEGETLPATTDEQREKLQRFFECLHDLSKKLQFPDSIINAFDVARTIAPPKSHERLHGLFCLFKDEAKSCRSLVLSPAAVHLYTNREPFGPAVADKFRPAADEIEHAAQCLALEQPTASIFHLMRAMERVVQSLSENLGIDKLEREWGKLLSDMHAAIERMSKGPERDAWSQAHANLYHVKQAWRNNTMHPKQCYTVEEAKEVIAAMKTFLVHLADLV